MPIYRFEDCFLNTNERRVVKDNNFIELTPKTFDLLVLFIVNGGHVLSKDDILEHVWNGSFVEEGNLAVHVSKLRRSLGATKTMPFIETVQGSGYRFIATVKTTSETEWRQQLPADDGHHDNESTSEPKLDSIAVLPFRNESCDSEAEYLCDGLTEGFINQLSRLPDLKVIARNTVFRYKNKEVEAKEVGATLGVAVVLTGRIRMLKDQIMIGVELTKVADGLQLWGTQLSQPFADIIEIQEKLILALTEQLKTQLTPQNTNQITQNSESYRLYLKGKYFLEKRTEKDIYKAIECFQKSISFDPTNIHSFVEIIEGYCYLYAFDYISYFEMSDKTKPYLNAISNLGRSIDVVYVVYGRKAYFDWNFDEAEKYYRKALALNPNCLIAHYRFAEYCVALGKQSQALTEINSIMRLDPLSISSYIIIGKMFYRMEMYESSLIYINDVLELEPNNLEALAVKGSLLTELQDFETALDTFRRFLELDFNVEMLAMIAYILALTGKSAEAEKIITQIQNQSHGNNKSYTILSRILLALGDIEGTIEHLVKGIDLHEIDLLGLNSDPRWAKIKNNERFKDITFRIGLFVN